MSQQGHSRQSDDSEEKSSSPKRYKKYFEKGSKGRVPRSTRQRWKKESLVNKASSSLLNVEPSNSETSASFSDGSVPPSRSPANSPLDLPTHSTSHEMSQSAAGDRAAQESSHDQIQSSSEESEDDHEDSDSSFCRNFECGEQVHEGEGENSSNSSNSDDDNPMDSDRDDGNPDPYADDGNPGDPNPDDGDPGDFDPRNENQQPGQPFRDPSLNERVVPISRLTKFDILVMVIHFALRFKLSDVALKALITLVNEILGVAVIAPSNYLLKKIFSSGKNIITYLYCSECHLFFGKKEECSDMEVCPAPNCDAPVDAKSLNRGHFFTSISIADQIREKLQSPEGENLLSYRENRAKDANEIRDVFDGIVFNQLNEKVSSDLSSFLTITASTDGAPVFENSSSSLWPVQFFLNETTPKERFAPYNMLVAGLWFGHPAISLITYLTFLIEELQTLATEGISWFRESVGRIEVTKVYCLNFIVDSIAKAKLLNMNQFNGYEGCYFCFHPGNLMENNQIRYLHQEMYPERTNESLREHMDEAEESNEIVHGMKGVSPTCFFPRFDLPWGVTIDYMHAKLLGTTKYLTSIWTDSENNAADFYLNNHSIQLIDRRIKNLQSPSNITRVLRPLSSSSLWKANEWRNWLFFFGPICLQGLLPVRYFRHFCLLSAAIYFFNQACIDRRQIVFYGDLLSAFVKEFQQHYGPNYMTYNVHLSVHIKACVTSCGPLWCYSAFSSESGIGYLVKFVRGPTGVAQQITQRYCLFSSIPTIVTLYNPLHEVVVNFCDSILSTRRFKTVGMAADDVVIVGDKFRKKFIPTNEECNSLTRVLPEIDVGLLYFIKKVIFKGSIYTSHNLKEIKRNDSFVLLMDGKYLKVLKFFISSLDYNQVYILGKELRLVEHRWNIFRLNNFHIRTLHQYNFNEDITIVPAAMIKEKCFFMTIENGLSFVSTFPNEYERD